VIGSDSSLNAIKASIENIENSQVGQFPPHSNFEISSNPITFVRHFPNSKTLLGDASIQETYKSPYLSLYHGDFQTIGSYISQFMDIKDFSIVTNVPYGNQILSPKAVKQSKDELLDYNQIQSMFRRFGRFLKETELKDAFVIARKMQYSNPLSFEKYSNLIWDKELDFVNGGMNVFMLRLRLDKINETKETIKAYLKG